MSRQWPVPTEGRTFHAFGDLHFGGLAAQRIAAITWDLNNGDVPNVVDHVTVGDLTNDATGSEDTAYLSFIAGLPGTVHPVIGNHDVDLNLNTRTPAAWAAVYGVPDKNYFVDLACGLRMIAVGFDSMADGAALIRLSDATLAYLDAQLTAAGSKPCIVVHHAPLFNTVGQTDGTHVETQADSSTSGNFIVAGSTDPGTDSGPLLAVYAAHSNVVMDLSGHTHSAIETPNMLTTVTAGGRAIAALNASCCFFTGTTSSAWDRCITPYVTWLDGKFEVRWRDHVAHQWAAPWNNPTGKVMTATVG